ncbi:MAG TPA: hypothetical protein VLF66_05315 [Thermoanaerobaculia bacterium]|nr:hypothetical protein [Thermoanaerobaculia bacterium]
MRPATRTPPRPSGREAGSAYIAVLLVLLLLTIAGLSLTLVTRIESEIGSAEKMIHRTFYAADSGLPAAVARHKIGGTGPFRFQMNSDGPGLLDRGDAVDVGNFFPVSVGFSNLSTANVGEERYRIDYLVLSQAMRFGASSPEGGNRHPFARQAVTVEVAIDPEQGPGDFLGLDRRSGRRLGERLQDVRSFAVP